MNHKAIKPAVTDDIVKESSLKELGLEDQTHVNHPLHRHVRLQKLCPLCESDDNKPVLSERVWLPQDQAPELEHFHRIWSHLLECNCCSFAFTQEIPVSPTFFKNRYDNRHFDPEHEVRSNRKDAIVSEVFSLIQKYCMPLRDAQEKSRLLDVGSFAGKILKEADEKGFRPTGVEVNPKLAQYSQEILGYEVICGEVQKVDLPKNHFDVVTIIDVLEHLVEPKEVLRTLSSTLKPGGLLVIKVPHYNMQKFKQKMANALRINASGIFGGYGHVNHFNPQSMRRVLDELGFGLEEAVSARSEHWPEDSFKNKVKNMFRDFYWWTSHFFAKTFGRHIGMNITYVAKKKS